MDASASRDSVAAACLQCSPLLATHSIPSSTPTVVLEATEAVSLLSDTEKMYAYWVGQASWKGALICLTQCSTESLSIFVLLLSTFGAQPLNELLDQALANGVKQSEIDDILMFSSAFFSNMGNYKSFGDTKFVPKAPVEQFRAFLLSSKLDSSIITRLFDDVKVRMYSLSPRNRQLGLGRENGVTTYFSPNCEESDAELAGRFLNSIKLSPYNTRLFKHEKADGSLHYIVMVSSALSGPPPQKDFPFEPVYEFEGAKFEIRLGDHIYSMRRVVECLRQASAFAANEHQVEMLRLYAASFESGSIDLHKDGSRAWIRDKSPAIETYIGFIESYRDPSGMRGEFEGFVACVNKEVSKKFQALVDSAEDFLKFMPWPKEFEKNEFLRPDFTSLDVISFGSSGVPAGINIPNYDDIRQNEGFKNVSLGNVLKAGYGASGDKPVSFINSDDQSLYKSLMAPAFEVQVGLHELLGHGSGRLFYPDDAKELKTVKNPLTGSVGDLSTYAENATWDTSFGKVASNYEECRAECTGIYLCLQPSILEVFGHSSQSAQEDLIYVNWLLMVRSGVLGLEYFTPQTKSWRQAHMNARFVILRVLLEAGEGLVRLEPTTDDGEANITIHLDRSKISSVGKKAIEKFMLKLQVYKSTGDVENGSQMFAKYSEVTDEMLEVRDIVLARKEPRKQLIQPNLLLGQSGVELRTYESDTKGMVQSWVDRYQQDIPELISLVEKGMEETNQIGRAV